MKRLGAPASSPALSEQPTGTSAFPGLVPKRRFPEFQDDREWNLLPLKSACQMQAGKLVQAADISEKPADGLFPCYGGNGLRGYTKTFTHSGKHPLIGRQGALCGNVKLADGDFHATEHAVVASARSGINVDWLFHTLELSNLNQYATGQAQPGVSVEVLEKVSIAVPPKEKEQQKIAECLSTLDELIGAASQKLDALKAHKKGLMQQLFPREGETLPRLRFPEFQNAGEWEMTPLSLAAENLDNQRVPITEKDRTRGSVPYYGASGIVDYVRDHLFDEDLLCVSEDGANLVARTYPIAFSISGKTWVNNHAHVLRFENRSTQKMVEDYLNTLDLTDYLTGMAQPKLNKAMLDKIPIPLPEPEEQHRIATCLSSLDDLMAAQGDQLKALKTHKKGLMQQLFPSPAEAEA